MGRSFKYHRPRGVWGAWFDDSNAIFNISLGATQLPNCPATTTYLEDGMQARSVNAFPSAQFDFKGMLDWFSPFLPAGFYYKTFMRPNWHLFEPTIRKMAGLGKLDGSIIEEYQSDQIHQSCDLLIVGAGPAGLAAALSASQNGSSVALVDDHNIAGGSIYQQQSNIENKPASLWVKQQTAAITGNGGRILLSTTAYGIYDHNLVALVEDNGFGRAPRLWRMRAKRILIATGAIDRPITFANNDRPGIMSTVGALEFLGRYGVLVGKNIALLSNNSHTQNTANLLREAGAKVEQFDADENSPVAIGGKKLRALNINGKSHSCDVILASGGLTPVVHLWRHAGGGLEWNEAIQAFIPAKATTGMRAAGAANGIYELDEALADARAAALDQPSPKVQSTYQVKALSPDTGSGKRQWIDFQHDVTVKDIELAARENYASVEHLKRYTTLGMASDQGKTSNMAGLAVMASLQNRTIPEVGTTTFRPPFVPVPFEIYRGIKRQQLFNPPKRLTLEAEHRNASAAMGEYGGWLRPAWYGNDDPQDTIRKEVISARTHVAIIDASPLGKIEIMGPDAEKFVNFVFYNTLAILKPGKIRYALMLSERGIVYDDAVITRLDQNRFIISCSSSHVEGVNDALEAWRQDGNNPDRIFVHDTTQNWATITLSGPKAGELLSKLDVALDLSPGAFPHMTFKQTYLLSAPARISRVSFTGDPSYEISVPTLHASALWSAITKAGKSVQAAFVGVEALSVLRAEKGYIIVGKDTDGETMPHDIGFSLPRLRKKSAFVGDRALHTESANANNRRQLVGLMVKGEESKLVSGAHLIDPSGIKPRSIGYVTSSYDSPTLTYPIALALMENGTAQIGESVAVWNQGDIRQATITSPCFYDKGGELLNA
jgi:sarcosine oxidase subunit alpha